MQRLLISTSVNWTFFPGLDPRTAGGGGESVGASWWYMSVGTSLSVKVGARVETNWQLVRRRAWLNRIWNPKI